MSPHILSPLREFCLRNSYLDSEIGLDISFKSPPVLPKLLSLFRDSSIGLLPKGFIFFLVTSPYDPKASLVSPHNSVPRRSQYFLVVVHGKDLDDTS